MFHIKGKYLCLDMFVYIGNLFPAWIQRVWIIYTNEALDF